MTRQDIEIEIQAYREVIYQLSKGDARMEIKLDILLRSLEDKIEDLKSKIK